MSLIWILVPMALFMGGSALVLFIWAANHGQFDDLDTPPQRILIEENPDDRQ